MKQWIMIVVMALTATGIKAQNFNMNIIVDNAGQNELYERVDSITFPDQLIPQCQQRNGMLEFPWVAEREEQYKVVSIVGETIVSGDFNGTVYFGINALVNDNMQTFLVTDMAGEKVLMIGRAVTTNKFEYIDINYRSTAMALVTMHPLFVPVGGLEYDKLQNIVISCQSYNTLEREVENTIMSGRDLLDTSNEELTAAIGDVIEEMCSKMKEVAPTYPYSEEMEVTAPVARRAYDRMDMYPFYCEVNGNTVTLRNTKLTPSYFGTVNHSGGEDKISVLSRPDYGVLDMYRTIAEMDLGPACNYTFTHEGNYEFNLSCMGAAAELDFCMNMISSILSAFGLKVKTQVQVEMANIAGRLLIEKGMKYDDPALNPHFLIGLFRDAIIEYIEKNPQEFAGDLIIGSAKMLKGVFSIYDKIKGTSNSILRITYRMEAPQKVNFTLFYNGYETEPGYHVTLEIVSGNDQIGKPGQELPQPLVVRLTGEDNRLSNLKIKFYAAQGKVSEEMVTTDGENCASVNWTLGTSESEYVQAYVVDMITGKRASEIVTFYADLELPINCPDEHHPHAIDLGLPSGQLWACCNVGTDTPTGYGGLYAWGETTTKETYYQENYKYYRFEKNKRIITKYNGTDGNTELDAGDDAATVHMGTTWRMPTKDEAVELLNKCTWKWIGGHQIRGMLVKGPNGNYLFMPAGGSIEYTFSYSSSFKPGTHVAYWTNTLHSDVNYNYCAYVLAQNGYGKMIVPGTYRYVGKSIRGVWNIH